MFLFVNIYILTSIVHTINHPCPLWWHTSHRPQCTHRTMQAWIVHHKEREYYSRDDDDDDVCLQFYVLYVSIFLFPDLSLWVSPAKQLKAVPTIFCWRYTTLLLWMRYERGSDTESEKRKKIGVYTIFFLDRSWNFMSLIVDYYYYSYYYFLNYHHHDDYYYSPLLPLKQWTPFDWTTSPIIHACS